MAKVEHFAATSLRTRLLALVAAVVALPELALRFLETTDGPGAGMVGALCAPLVARYLPVRAALLSRPVAAAVVAALTVPLGFVVVRAVTKLWFNEVRPRLAGTHFTREPLGFPSTNADLLELVRSRPPGTTVVGVAPPNHSLPRWRPLHPLPPHKRSPPP